MRLAAFLLALPLFGQSIPFPGPGTPHTVATGGAFISGADLGGFNSPGDFTVAFDCPTGSTICVCGVWETSANTASNITGVDYNSVAMTQISTASIPLAFQSGVQTMWRLFTPATGSHNLVVHLSTTTLIFGVACGGWSGLTATDSAAVKNPATDNTGTITNTLTTSYTTTAANATVILAGQAYDGSTDPLVAGANLTQRVAISMPGAATVSYGLFDSGNVASPATANYTFTIAGAAAFAPGAIAQSFK